MENKPSCFYCKNAGIDGGFAGSYDEQGWAAFVEECKSAEVSDLFDTEVETEGYEERLPGKCGHYDPHVIEVCCECKKAMGIPIHEVEFYVSGMFDDVPCCSQECKDTGNKKFEDDMREMADGQLNQTPCNKAGQPLSRQS